MAKNLLQLNDNKTEVSIWVQSIHGLSPVSVRSHSSVTHGPRQGSTRRLQRNIYLFFCFFKICPHVSTTGALAKVLLCAIAYFPHMDTSATPYSHNYKLPFDISRKGDVAHDKIEC